MIVVKYSVKNAVDISTQQENPTIRSGVGKMFIDNNGHMWYKFNKWSCWIKFENEAIKIDVDTPTAI